MKIDNFLATYNAQNAMLTKTSTNKKDEDEAKFDAALKEQTDAFESFLVKSILDISMKNKPSIFEKDASDEIYSSMYNDTMSKALSGGMGYSELLFSFLKERA